MSPLTQLDALYTSAPIVDYDEDAHEPDGNDVYDESGPGGATLAPEAFDAAMLAALITP
jgi:hypothetical protein